MDFDLNLQDTLAAMTEKVTGWVEGFILALPNFVAAVLVLVLFWIGARIVRRILARALEHVSSYRAVNHLLSTIAYVSVLAVGLFVALGVLDLDKTVTSLLAGAGILGLAIGFAAQDSVENLLSGIMLSIRRPIRVGDLVETNGTFGVVQEVNLRETRVRTGPGQIVYIPNSDIYTEPLTNFSQLGRRRVEIACGVAYGDDLEEARRSAVGAIEGLEMRDESRDVEFYWEEFGASSVNFKVRFWIEFSASHADFLAARSEGMVRLKRAFDENGITIPFPITTLDFRVVGGTPLSEELAGVSVSGPDRG